MNYSLTRSPFFFDSFFAPSKYEVKNDWSPSVDVVEKKNDYIIRAELPGLDEKDVSVEVKDNVLTLKGERKSEYNNEEDNVYRSEIYHGSFSRSFNVENVDQEKIKAKFKNGLLTLTLPKVKEEEPKRIEIKIN